MNATMSTKRASYAKHSSTIGFCKECDHLPVGQISQIDEDMACTNYDPRSVKGG